jgi:hypothetical protein
MEDATATADIQNSSQNALEPVESGKDYHLLITGFVILNIGFFGMLTGNPFLAWLCFLVSLMFFSRQLVELKR